MIFHGTMSTRAGTGEAAHRKQFGEGIHGMGDHGMGMAMALFMEAFVSIHMSVFVLLPLSKMISRENSKKNLLDIILDQNRDTIML